MQLFLVEYSHGTQCTKEAHVVCGGYSSVERTLVKVVDPDDDWCTTVRSIKLIADIRGESTGLLCVGD